MLLHHPVPRVQGALFRYLFAYYPILYPYEDRCKLTLILDIGHPAPANKVFGMLALFFKEELHHLFYTGNDIWCLG
jgi:hypothetical protein